MADVNSRLQSLEIQAKGIALGAGLSAIWGGLAFVVWMLLTGQASHYSLVTMLSQVPLSGAVFAVALFLLFHTPLRGLLVALGNAPWFISILSLLLFFFYYIFVWPAVFAGLQLGVLVRLDKHGNPPKS